MVDIPKIIKGIGYTKFNGEMKITEFPLKELGPSDVLIRIEAVSINPIDYKWVKIMVTQDFFDKGNTYIQGHDASGVIIKVGSAVKKFKIGDEVMYAGEFNIFKYGSNANYQIVDENVIGMKPKTLSFSQAAALPLTALTAYECFFDEMHFEDNPSLNTQNKNKILLIIGGAGGVGTMAIQFAKNLLGLTVIATASRHESIVYCKKMGADHVINHQGTLQDQLNRIGIKSIDYIICNTEITSQLLSEFERIINPLGYIVGILGTIGPIDINKISFFKRVRLTFENLPTRIMFNVDIEKYHERLNRISELIDSGTIQTNATVYKQFNLENIKQEHEVSKQGKAIGKVVLENVQSYFW